MGRISRTHDANRLSRHVSCVRRRARWKMAKKLGLNWKHAEPVREMTRIGRSLGIGERKDTAEELQYLNARFYPIAAISAPSAAAGSSAVQISSPMPKKSVWGARARTISASSPPVATTGTSIISDHH